MQTFSFLVGASLGGALGLVLFCFMVPHGPKAIKMMQHYAMHMQGDARRNKEEFKAVMDTSMGGHMMEASNPYMMGKVTSEKQFLEEMVAHHQSAVEMAKQVLGITSIHPEVKKLADDIIASQGTEIKMMKDWMAAWKY